jgi:hypothetical protein
MTQNIFLKEYILRKIRVLGRTQDWQWQLIYHSSHKNEIFVNIINWLWFK